MIIFQFAMYENFFSYSQGLIIVFIVIVLSILSCTNKSERQQGYLYLRLRSNPATLDPALIVDVTGGAIAAKIFNGLVRLDEQLKVAPDVAESWEISRDGRTYTFYLKKGAKFLNGRNVTSCGFKYSFAGVLSAFCYSFSFFLPCFAVYA